MEESPHRTALPTKFISFVLSVVLLSTNCLFAHKSDVNLWDERKKSVRSQQFASLPKPIFKSQISNSNDSAFYSLNHWKLKIKNLSPYGTVREISQPKSQNSKNQLIIHIQDVHMNQEARQNIEQAVQSLIQTGQVDLLALEGAFGPIDLKPFQAFPHQDTVQKVADYLLRENKISGPIHAALAAEQQKMKKGKNKLPYVIGVDDEIHYQLNVDAYRQSVPLIASAKNILKVKNQQLIEKKSATFNHELSSFDAKIQAYRQGHCGLSSYVTEVVTHASNTSASINNFLEALKLESALMYPQVEKERSHLLSILIPRLNKDEKEEMFSSSTAYRLGHLSHSDFYEAIKNLCRKKGIRLEQFPALTSYIRFVLLSESINADQLFNDLQASEKTAYEQLAKTPEEKDLIRKSRQVYLTEKLLDFALTKEEWEEYRKGEKTLSLQSFEAFYIEAEKRDRLMADNFLKAVLSSQSSVLIKNPKLSTENREPSTVVLVTGGFHSKGIDNHLTKAGYTVISFVPKITKIDTESGSTYLSVFTQEKTPLDKLFEGQTLFLSPPQWGPTIYKLAVLLIVSVALLSTTVSIDALEQWASAIWGTVIHLQEAGHNTVQLVTGETSLNVQFSDLFLKDEVSISVNQAPFAIFPFFIGKVKKLLSNEDKKGPLKEVEALFEISRVNPHRRINPLGNAMWFAPILVLIGLAALGQELVTENQSIISDVAPLGLTGWHALVFFLMGVNSMLLGTALAYLFCPAGQRIPKLPGFEKDEGKTKKIKGKKARKDDDFELSRLDKLNIFLFLGSILVPILSALLRPTLLNPNWFTNSLILLSLAHLVYGLIILLFFSWLNPVNTIVGTEDFVLFVLFLLTPITVPLKSIGEAFVFFFYRDYISLFNNFRAQGRIKLKELFGTITIVTRGIFRRTVTVLSTPWILGGWIGRRINLFIKAVYSPLRDNSPFLTIVIFWIGFKIFDGIIRVLSPQNESHDNPMVHSNKIPANTFMVSVGTSGQVEFFGDAFGERYGHINTVAPVGDIVQYDIMDPQITTPRSSENGVANTFFLGKDQVSDLVWDAGINADPSSYQTHLGAASNYQPMMKVIVDMNKLGADDVRKNPTFELESRSGDSQNLVFHVQSPPEGNASVVWSPFGSLQNYSIVVEEKQFNRLAVAAAGYGNIELRALIEALKERHRALKPYASFERPTKRQGQRINYQTHIDYLERKLIEAQRAISDRDSVLQSEKDLLTLWGGLIPMGFSLKEILEVTQIFSEISKKYALDRSFLIETIVTGETEAAEKGLPNGRFTQEFSKKSLVKSNGASSKVDNETLVEILDVVLKEIVQKNGTLHFPTRMWDVTQRPNEKIVINTRDNGVQIVSLRETSNGASGLLYWLLGLRNRAEIGAVETTILSTGLYFYLKQALPEFMSNYREIGLVFLAVVLFVFIVHLLTGVVTEKPKDEDPREWGWIISLKATGVVIKSLVWSLVPIGVGIVFFEGYLQLTVVIFGILLGSLKHAWDNDQVSIQKFLDTFFQEQLVIVLRDVTATVSLFVARKPIDPSKESGALENLLPITHRKLDDLDPRALADAQQRALDEKIPNLNGSDASIQTEDAFVLVPRFPFDFKTIDELVKSARKETKTVIAVPTAFQANVEKRIPQEKKSFVSVISVNDGFYFGDGDVLDVALVLERMKFGQISFKNVFIGRERGVGYALPPPSGQFENRVFLVPVCDLLNRMLSETVYNLPYLRSMDAIARSKRKAA